MIFFAITLTPPFSLRHAAADAITPLAAIADAYAAIIFDASLPFRC